MKECKKEDKQEESQSSNSTGVEYCLEGNYSLTTSSSNFAIGTTNSTISNISGSNSLWISPDYSMGVQKKMVQKILDGQIELESLIDKGQTEVFEIDEIKFEKKQSRIKCNIEVDLNYVEKLKSKNELLLEFVAFVDLEKSDSNTFWYYNNPNNILIYTGGTTLVGNAGGNSTITVNPTYWTSTTTIPANCSYTFGTSNSVATMV